MYFNRHGFLCLIGVKRERESLLIVYIHIQSELVPEKTSKELAHLDSSLHFKHPPYFCSSQRIYLINNRYFSFPSSININFMRERIYFLSSTVSDFLAREKGSQRPIKHVLRREDESDAIDRL